MTSAPPEIRIGALLLLLLSGCSSPPAKDPSGAPSGPPALAASGACSASGYCWENPVPAGGLLNAAWAAGPNDLYVAGGSERILHFDGTVWKVESEDKGWEHGRWLNGLWGSGPDDVIAVGDKGLLQRRKGGAWRSEDVEDTNSFEAVWGSGPDDVFAVGDEGVVFHYDGKSWSGQTTGTSATLQSVWGSGPKDVYAVGHSSSSQSGVVMHYDGRDWEVAAELGSRVEAVWGAGPKDVWVAGADEKERLAVWRLSAGAGEWKREGISARGRLIALSGAGGKPVLLGHEDTSPTDLSTHLRGQVFSLEWTGSTWQRRPLMTISSPIGMPSWGLASDTKGAMIAAGWWGVVGTFRPGEPVSGKEEMLFSNGNVALGKNLQSVWGTSPTDVVAVGAAGTMIHWDGRTWTLDPAGKDHDFAAIHGAKGLLVAVGRGGVMLTRKGGAWSEVKTGSSVDLQTVWTDGDRIFAAGDAGTMLHCDERGCAQPSTGVKKDLSSVWGVPGDVVVMGFDGVLLRWDGASYKMLTSPKNDLSLVGPDGRGGMMSVGFTATYRLEQGMWTRIGDGYGAPGGYWSLADVGEGQVVGVYGGGGAPVGAHRWNGVKWTDELLPSDSGDALGAGRLNSVWGQGGEVFIVGSGGAILHKKPR